MANLLRDCAHAVLETAPQVTQFIRVEIRRRRAAGISVPQFRALAFIDRNPDKSLSDLAEHLGLTLPSVSKLIDGLVKQKYITRRESSVDRRRLTMVLTAAGRDLLRVAREGAQARLMEILGELAEKDLESICHAMDLLRPLFVPGAKG